MPGRILGLDTPEPPMVNSECSNKILMSGKGRKIFMDDQFAAISSMRITPPSGDGANALSECAC